MPKGSYLSSEEKSVITAHKENGMSNAQIAFKIQISEKVIRNYLRLGENYGQKKKTKGNKKITERQKGQIRDLATKQMLTASQIITELDLPIKKRRVQKILNTSQKVVYKKQAKSPALTKAHKDAVRKHAHEMDVRNGRQNGKNSYEKKFNLDGPDGFSYFRHDLKAKEEKG